MTKLLYIPLVFLLIACTLDSRQEEKLNVAFQDYIKAYNEDLMLQYVALTHVKVVAHYKAKSENEFVQHFQKPKTDSLKAFYGDYLTKDTKESGNYIQRCYTIEKYTRMREIDPEYRIYACSEDKGNTWFFINEDDYFDLSIPLKKRLFKK
jgi:hypothetical protein